MLTAERISVGSYPKNAVWYFCTDTVRLYGGDGTLAEESITPHLCNGYEYEILEAQRCFTEGLKESTLNPLSEPFL